MTKESQSAKLSSLLVTLVGLGFWIKFLGKRFGIWTSMFTAILSYFAARYQDEILSTYNWLKERLSKLLNEPIWT